MLVSLTPEILLQAYTQGFFPMAEGQGQRIYWYEPDPRAIFELDKVHFSKRLLRLIRQERFEIRYSTAFERVIRACADRPSTWISEEIIRTYIRLYRTGYGQSVESWLDGELVGGLYGVSLGGAFFGESMFCRVSDASKVAFFYLVERLRGRGFALLDTQFANEHLVQFHVVEIPRREYRQRLKGALALPCKFR
ncbi:leucyl/phenylalanyl-tRNA--protein transferase [Gloeobacter morelensis]|uniref:Leucyl/phenylalanyl-tRNA--protein transferase n=1 Tax=Gloeobacter morelensis MG652769 TaxID=2781736 RepID=A0ABY3PT90_9CYAN|nr:leucyl/phenylalanyl-tRNA--protein transferase [Gloeobacter morelensis]UFP96708.1 leucyl/phenylalanyl-tRNA--protein transferase [Gloeobacter morelensis MG652769]